MTDNIRDKRFFCSSVIILGLVLVVYLFRAVPILDSDSASYILASSIRPPMYPIFLWLFHDFGKSQLEVAIWVQCILSLLSLLYIARWLHKRLEISGFLISVILLCTVGLIYFYYRTGQTICSEAIAFPFFIATFSLLVDCFYIFNIKKLILLVIFANLLILTRAQFYYFYFLFVILIAWYAWRKISPKNIMIAIIIIILSIATTAVSNRGYHLLKHGHFADVPLIGNQLIIQALFLSKMDAVQYFENPIEKQVFSTMINQLEQKHFTKNSSLLAMKPAEGFHATYAYHNAVYSAIQQVNNSILGKLSGYQKDVISLNISKVLYRHAIKENLIFYCWKIVSFFGDISIFLFFIIVFFAACFRVFISQGGNLSFCSLYTCISLLTILINTAFVAIFEPLLPAYSYYSYFLIFTLGGLLAKSLGTIRRNI